MLCLHQTIAIGKDEPAGLGQNRELAYARELAERGYVTLAPDYPNFGEYKINVYDLGYASATMKAIWNNLRAIDLLCSLDEVDPCSNRCHRPLTRRPQCDLHGVVRRPDQGGGLVVRLQRVPFLLQRQYRGLVAPGLHAPAANSLRARSQESPFRLPRADRRAGPTRVFHELTAARRQFRGRRCAGVHRLPRGPVYELERAADRLVAIFPDAEHSFPKRPASRLIASWIAFWHHRLDTAASVQNA